MLIEKQSSDVLASTLFWFSITTVVLDADINVSSH